ncbi:MAG: carotenoid oxygenase family protein [Planctomycetota bacterium]
MTDRTMLSRRRFSQLLAGAAAAGWLELPYAARLLGRRTNRLSWRAHRTAGAEGVWALDDIDGEIPADLHGTLYRTAPGESERFGVTFQHLFDGDAYLSGYSFRDGKVTLRAGFLDQPRRLREQEAGKMLYSEFGTATPDGNGRDGKNQPSVNVIPWDGRLLGLSEGGHPTAIDPATLRTQGGWDFHGTLPQQHSFTAHPKFDPATGLGYCYGIVQGPGMALRVYRMERDGTLTNLFSLPQRGYFMVHDMMLTAEHIVFLVPPVTFDLGQLMNGEGTIGDCLRYAEDRPLRVLVMRKDGEGVADEIDLDAGMVFHHGNARLDSDQLILDSLLSPSGDVLKFLHAWAADKMPRGQPVQATRLTIDLAKGELASRDVFAEQEEFPRFDERHTGTEARYLYAAGQPPKDDGMAFQALVRHDRREGTDEARRVAAHQTVAEPVFVPRNADAAEGDGWLLQLGYDGRRDQTFLDVVDAGTLDRAARVWTGTHIPLGFHGTFAPDLFVAAE